MNKLSLEEGRVEQKLQTRTEILKAAKVLMQKRKKITLEDVATQAGISRATIYRYFSNVDLLFTEASLDVYHRSPEELIKEADGQSIEQSILFLQQYYNHLAQKHENGFRRYLSTALSESVSSKKKIRGARRVSALKLALKPFRKQMSAKTIRNLTHISTILMGIDALVVAKDVCGLNNRQTSELLQWGIEMLLRGIECEH